MATNLLSGDDLDRKSPTKDRVRIKKLKMEVYVPTLEFLQRDRLKEEDYKKLDKMKNVCSVSSFPSFFFQFSYVFILINKFSQR